MRSTKEPLQIGGALFAFTMLRRELDLNQQIPGHTGPGMHTNASSRHVFCAASAANDVCNEYCKIINNSKFCKPRLQNRVRTWE